MLNFRECSKSWNNLSVSFLYSTTVWTKIGCLRLQSLPRQACVFTNVWQNDCFQNNGLSFLYDGDDDDDDDDDVDDG